MAELTTNSVSETQELGRQIGAKLKGGEILALSGPLGSGKTAFVKGLARGLGIRRRIKSPTFVIYQIYPAPRKKRQATLYHFDLYRLKATADLRDLGFAEILITRENIVIIEWPEKARRLLPKRTMHLKFKHWHRPNQRRIIFKNVQ